jgi:hypothetical protein
MRQYFRTMEPYVSRGIEYGCEWNRNAGYWRNNMKFYCFGYYDEEKWQALSEGEQKEFMDECFAYDDVLRKNGHIAGGDALDSVRNAVTVRWKGGKESIEKGPYIKSKEQMGGILILEARDMNQAVELISRHPGLKAGPFEVRAVEDMSVVIAESERRRAQKKAS